MRGSNETSSLRNDGVRGPVRAVAMLLLGACGGTIEGEVTDYETGAPIEGATVTALQRGWGISNGQLVWDKDRSRTVTTNQDGWFAVTYRGSSVKLLARTAGYQRFEASYGRAARPHLRLKRRVEIERPLPGGFMRLGIREDGSMYGWDFGAGRITTSPEEADVFPVSVDPDPRGPITFRTPASGGVRFLSGAELGVDALFLVYTDVAPETGYATTARIDFASGGGVFFVRTREGRFAKVEFTPTAFAQSLDPGVTRDLSLQYVYNPDGSRNLLHQVPE